MMPDILNSASSSGDHLIHQLENIDIPDTSDEIISSMSGTLYSIWMNFIAHLPLLFFGFLILFLTWIITRFISRVADKSLKKRQVRGSLRVLAKQFIAIFVWAIGLIFSAMVFFPSISPAEALGGLGILSIGISFAFKNIFENFFTGVMILWKYPFEVGDYIQCEGKTGQIEQITTRMLIMRDTSGELQLIPNSMIFNNPVEILTHWKKRRAEIFVGVGYDEDVEKAIKVIREAVSECESIDKSKSLQVFPHRFGESGVDIEIAWWCGATPLDHRQSKGEVITAVKKALDKAGIEIPFPYRTLVFKEPLKFADEKTA